MSTHAEIIQPAQAEAIAGQLGVSVHTVRSWRQRNSIPAEHWPAMIAAGIASLEELSPQLAEVIAQSDAA